MIHLCHTELFFYTHNQHLHTAENIHLSSSSNQLLMSTSELTLPPYQNTFLFTTHISLEHDEQTQYRVCYLLFLFWPEVSTQDIFITNVFLEKPFEHLNLRSSCRQSGVCKGFPSSLLQISRSHRISAFT